MKALDHITWLKEGRQFLRVAQRAYHTRTKLTPEILCNVLGLSVGKCLMAALDVHDRLPDNHTFTDLVEATNRVAKIDPNLCRDLIDPPYPPPLPTRPHQIHPPHTGLSAN